jgi:hypothetical protein
LVEANEALEEILAGGIVVGTAGVVGEVVAQRRSRELFSKQVDLVEE